MILSGIIRFFSSNGNLLYERKYHTIEGRAAIIEKFCKDREDIYYHILPGYRYVTRSVILDKPVPIIRPKAEYDNLKAYRYDQR